MEKITKKIYIDCGAWTGDSVLKFKEIYDNYTIYAFECEPRLKYDLEILSKKHNFNFINKAVWIENSEINLYPGIENFTQSSSLSLSKKKLIDKKNPVLVKTIDFPKWITNNFKKDDYIMCKMNIEGAEYEVLEKMLLDGSINYIDKLYVAWHYKKLKDFSNKRHNKLKNKLKNKTMLLEWNFESEDKDPF